MKNTANKTKISASKSARISIRTTPEIKAEFVRKAKAQGCTQSSLFENMLQDNRSWGRKIPPTLFVPIDDAINNIDRSSWKYEIHDITHNLKTIRESMSEIKKEYGFGGN